MNSKLEISWNARKLSLLADRAIHLASENVLFIADPHFGKAATFRKSGIPVPEKSTQADCDRLTHLINETKVETLVILGDFFHARLGKTDEVHQILFEWREIFKDLKILLIRGNHDIKSGDPWTDLNIQCHPDPFELYDFECRHIPVANSNKPFLAGHIHPGFTLRGKGKSSIRSACFHLNESMIILPAFGSFTGLKNIKPENKDKIFLTNGVDIFKVPNGSDIR